MKFISFSFDNLIYVLIYVISIMSQMYIIEKTQNYPRLIFMFLDSFSLLFFVILEDISIYFNTMLPRKYKQPKKEKKNKIQIITINKYPNDYFNKKLISLVVLGILTVLNSYFTLFVYFSLLIGLNAFSYMCNIVLTWMILRLCFKWKMYRHHIFAFVIIAITLTVSFSLNPDIIIYFYYFLNNSYSLMIGGLIIVIIVQSFREVIEKYALDYLYMRHTKILFYEGVISLVINLLFFGILQLFNCQETEEVSINLLQFCYESQIKIIKDYFL